MIYELVLVAHPDSGEEKLANLKTIVEEVVKSSNGDIVVQDDWGSINLAQATERRVTRGTFMYFIYKANVSANDELVRRFRITEGVLRHMIVKLGENEKLDGFVKSYKTPFSKKYSGSVLDSIDEESDRYGKKKFIKTRGCWYDKNAVSPDWKDPASFTWLLNEFGKISPARISGITRKNQNKATSAIKRARQLGIISHMNSDVAYQ